MGLPNLQELFDDLRRFGIVRASIAATPDDLNSKAALKDLTFSLLNLSLDTQKVKHNPSAGEEEPAREVEYRPRKAKAKAKARVQAQPQAKTPAKTSPHKFGLTDSATRIILLAKILFSYSAFLSTQPLPRYAKSEA